jgi:signal peptidase I
MVPTLLAGDYLFVSKFSYGYSRYSLPFGLPLIPGRVLFTPPERGDVAVFKLPRDNETDYIKRIIGLPGDRIQVTEGRLYINDEMVERKHIGEYVIRINRGDFKSMPLYLETLPNGRSHGIIEISDEMTLDNTDEFLVPEGHYFAMGDNRDNSMDSRVLAGVGFVPELNLVGHAERLFFSHDESARVWQFWKWPSAIRYGRLFQKII